MASFPLASCMQTDNNVNTVRRIELSSRVVTTVAGDPESSGYQDGIGSNAQFYITSGVAINPSESTVYVVRWRGLSTWLLHLPVLPCSCLSCHPPYVHRPTFTTASSALSLLALAYLLPLRQTRVPPLPTSRSRSASRCRPKLSHLSAAPPSLTALSAAAPISARR
jgi:hypothetical protein